MKNNDYKRYYAGTIVFLLPFFLFAQSQYDYMDDDAVAGGVDRALNGIIFFVCLIAFVILLIIIIGGALNVYYWFFPKANPNNNQSAIKNRKNEEIEKERAIQNEKQVILDKEKNKKKDAVDLGLSVLWADSNLFADSLSNIGAKFSWGDRNARSYFGYTDCILNEMWEWDLKMIIRNDDLSICGNKKFDAATYLWGEEWRLPQKYEFDELIEKCEWQWTVLNGVKGYKVIGKNGNSIFMPITGENVLDGNQCPETGYYWSGIASRNYKEAKCLYFDSQIKTVKNDGQRWHGMAIRPVLTPHKLSIEEILNIVDSKGVAVKGDDISAYINYCQTFALTDKPKTNDIIHDLDIRKMYSSDGYRLLSTYNGRGGENVRIDVNPKPGTKIICDGAYDDFTDQNIREIHIPDTVIAIGNNAFMCSGAREIIIPASVKFITGNPFVNIFGIFIQPHCESPYFKLTDGVLYSTDKTLYVANLERQSKLKVIPEGIKIIGRGAIINHDELELLRIPSSVVAIAEGAISSCINLSVLIFDGKVSVIEPTAINGNIKVVFVPFGMKAYYQDILPEMLKAVVMEPSESGKTDEEILHDVIIHEDNLISNRILPKIISKNIICHEDLAYIEQVKLDYNLTSVTQDEWNEEIIDWGEHEKEENDIWERGEASYSKDGKKLLRFEDKDTECKIRDGVEIVCDNSFSHIYGEKHVILPSSIRIMGNFVFTQIDLGEFVIPQNVTIITGNPFAGCFLKLECKSPQFVLEDNILYDKEKKRTVSVIKDLEMIFQKQPMPISPNVIVIGRYSFYDISYSGPVQLPNSVLYIGDSAFEHAQISDIQLGDSIIEIGNESFAWSYIESIVLPDSVERLGISAFDWCERLKNVKLSSSLTSIEEKAFRYCKSLREIIIPEGVKIIKKEAFCCCSNLTKIHLPDSLEQIEEGAFTACGIKTIVVPKHTVIAYDAFMEDCTIIRR